MAALFAAFLSVLCFIFRFVTEIYQCVKTFVHFKDYIAAATAVASVRTAIRNI